MYFGLSEDQLMLQDSVGRYLEGASELEEVRKFVDGEGALAETLHKGLEELGVPFRVAARGARRPRHGRIGSGVNIRNAGAACVALGLHRRLWHGGYRLTRSGR